MNKFLFFSLLFLVACNNVADEIDGTTYEPEFAIPVISDASVSFVELWQNNAPGQSLVVQPDGGLVFRYESEPIEVSTVDFVGALEFPIITSLPEDTIARLPFVLPANIIIEEAALSGGILILQFQPILDRFVDIIFTLPNICLLYTSPSPRDATLSRMPSSA